jgi:hypothetical protein
MFRWARAFAGRVTGARRLLRTEKPRAHVLLLLTPRDLKLSERTFTKPHAQKRSRCGTRVRFAVVVSGGLRALMRIPTQSRGVPSPTPRASASRASCAHTCGTHTSRSADAPFRPPNPDVPAAVSNGSGPFRVRFQPGSMDPPATAGCPSDSSHPSLGSPPS